MLSLGFRLAMMGAGLFLLNALFPQAVSSVDDVGRLAYFSLLLLVVVSSAALPRLRRDGVIAIVVWGGAFAVLTAGYAWQDDLRAGFERRLGVDASMAAIARGPGEVELIRTWDGHFRAMVTAGGAEAPFLVDTGASLVLIRWEDAAALGVDLAALDFSTPVLTANGETLVAAVWMPEMRIGNVALRDVRAAVAPPGTLQGGLLGMSFLGRLQEITIRGDHITLRN